MREELLGGVFRVVFNVRINFGCLIAGWCGMHVFGGLDFRFPGRRISTTAGRGPS